MLVLLLLLCFCCFPSSDGFDEVQLRGLVASNALGFDDWTSLISAVEDAYPVSLVELLWTLHFDVLELNTAPGDEN